MVDAATSRLSDLHTHLYGALTVEDIEYLISRCNSPRYAIFTDSYRNVYGKLPDLSLIKTCINNSGQQNEEVKENLKHLIREYYVYKGGAGFDGFQCSFNFLIAFARLDREELFEVCRRVVSRQSAAYCEYRMMFPETYTQEEFAQKVTFTVRALQDAESKAGAKSARLVVSLSRDLERATLQYLTLRELMMQEGDNLWRMIVGVDFCGCEEGNPPHILIPLIQDILKDNTRDRIRSLAVLYHVGESYRDKSAESAVRWIVSVALSGVHRIGHALALGIPAAHYRSQTVHETKEERLDHLLFLKEHYESLKDYDYPITLDEIERELNNPQELTVRHHYDQERIDSLSIFQRWAAEKIRKSGAVIETCPTSNLRVAGIGERSHPLSFFLSCGLPVVIGSDDLAIFDTTIEEEYKRIAEWTGISEQQIEELILNGNRYLSRHLARKRAEEM